MNIGQWLHFSIDDVINSLKWVYQNHPKSVFEEPMFCKLKEWHEEYKINCDLYVFETTDGFKLTDLQDKYWEELGKEDDWLKFGWHRRKAGVLTDDAETEIESFDRIHKLIIEKTSQRSWSNVLRLHRWEVSQALAKHMSDNGVRRLLTADSNRLSYGLMEDDCATLQEKGILWKAPFSYLTTDIRFDNFSDGMTVDNCINYTQRLINERPYKGQVVVFCHEWKLKEIVSEIEQYWAGFSKIQIDLYINTSVVIDNCLYFTTCNTNFLFKKLLSCGDTEVVTELPCKTHNGMKFSSLVLYGNSIWMIPWLEDIIIVYEMTKKTIKMLPIPYECEEEPLTAKFRKVVQNQKYLWLLPRKTPLLARIDMEKESVNIFLEWPKEVFFAKEQKMNFTSMCVFEKYLYLFRYGCSHNVRVNMDNGCMEIWDAKVSKEFGIVTDGKLYVSPVRSGDDIRCYELHEFGKETLNSLPQWLWAKERIYAFWYSERIGKFIYFLPHEAHAVIRENLVDGNIDCISFKLENYRSLRQNPEFAAYEAFCLEDDNACIISYMGNKVIMIDDKGLVPEEVILSIPISQITKSYIQKRIAYENSNVGLLQLLDQVVLLQTGQWFVDKESLSKYQNDDSDIEINYGGIIYQKTMN